MSTGDLTPFDIERRDRIIELDEKARRIETQLAAMKAPRVQAYGEIKNAADMMKDDAKLAKFVREKIKQVTQEEEAHRALVLLEEQERKKKDAA